MAASDQGHDRLSQGSTSIRKRGTGRAMLHRTVSQAVAKQFL